MTIKLLAPYPPYLAGDLFKADPNTEAGLVKLGVATADTTGGVVNVSLLLAAYLGRSSPAFGWGYLGVSRSIAAADDGKLIGAASAITLTVPSGLSPRPTVCLRPPTSGQLTVTGNINGSVQSIVLGPVDNEFHQGWCLCANVGSDGYSLNANH